MSAEQGVEPRIGCVVDTGGRIVFEPVSRSAEGQQLLLRLRPRKEQPEKVRHILDLEPADDGGRRAVLDPDLVLPEGQWDVYLLRAPGSERQRLRPGLCDLRALVDGRLRDWQAPLAVRVPYATLDGYLAVRTWLRPAHAEVDAITITDRSTTVGARLHGASLQPGAIVRLRLRGGSGRVRDMEPQPEGDGRGFSFTCHYEELAAETVSGSGIWDVFVRPAAEAPLIRLACLLDDVACRTEVFVYPTVTVGGVGLRPYYTVDNDLSLRVTRAD
ncbi:transferase [Streptomyces chromofuscus]|uniref:transferase n=1 Tax=Streptomyces chromofuscus TaxID=42881 RepID=UPI0019B6AE3E|nr:transferase [Streptomyces chromofuscus]GGT45604.1 hypothetical protein GCM10010254_75490 [Streptomyces chromofuscus]